MEVLKNVITGSLYTWGTKVKHNSWNHFEREIVFDQKPIKWNVSAEFFDKWKKFREQLFSEET